jgi:transcriptional regulator GlxA family with amidase domain
MDYRVESLIALMRDDPHQALNVSMMARSVNLSASRLHYLFNADTSTPPARYLRIVRLQAAKILLETTFLSVKEIVAQVGGNDDSHFLRNFKKRYGVTPSEHRNASQNLPVKLQKSSAASPDRTFRQ